MPHDLALLLPFNHTFGVVLSSVNHLFNKKSQHTFDIERKVASLILFLVMFRLILRVFPNFIKICIFLVRSPFRFANRFIARASFHMNAEFSVGLARARFSFLPLNVRYGLSVSSGFIAVLTSPTFVLRSLSSS